MSPIIFSPKEKEKEGLFRCFMSVYFHETLLYLSYRDKQVEKYKGVGIMEIVDRIKLVKIIEKINENKDFSKKIGIMDASVFKKIGTRKSV